MAEKNVFHKILIL